MRLQLSARRQRRASSLRQPQQPRLRPPARLDETRQRTTRLKFYSCSCSKKWRSGRDHPTASSGAVWPCGMAPSYPCLSKPILKSSVHFCTIQPRPPRKASSAWGRPEFTMLYRREIGREVGLSRSESRLRSAVHGLGARHFGSPRERFCARRYRTDCAPARAPAHNCSS